VHVVELNVPVLLVVKVTVPVALLGLTAAVHVVAVLIPTDAGEHDTVVVVAVFWLTVSRNVPLLPEWTESPPYVPVINA
jgi:hypothetical protein